MSTLTIDEAAHLVGLTARQIRQAIPHGRLPAERRVASPAAAPRADGARSGPSVNPRSRRATAGTTRRSTRSGRTGARSLLTRRG